MHRVDHPRPSGHVLVLPGGQERSRARVRPWQLAQVRAALLARSLRRRLGPDYMVEQVRYRHRGWNAPDLDPVADGARAVRASGSQAGPIILVGHSMGARVAAHLAAAHDITGIVALAPWWPDEDADLIPPTCRVRVLHGVADSWTDAEASRRQTVRARGRGVDAQWSGLSRTGHFMLRKFSVWHSVAAQFVVEVGPCSPNSGVTGDGHRGRRGGQP
ncbi:alpha/beta fold hydrolase [Nocardia sp. NPDC052001]|uniref:alpha/beta fold hydrolase n=1 Tax=Nocardia sp. NPDC052001 TaxID=3154853 RepID=UPI00343BA2AB